MKQAALRLLACPACMGSLTLTAIELTGGDVVTGSLDCSGCGEHYPITRGIPRFVGQLESGVQVQSGVYSYWHSLLSKDLSFSQARDLDGALRTLGRSASDLAGHVVLDAGCGTGRFTRILSDLVGEHGLVIAMDVSNGVDRAQEYLAEKTNCLFVRGNLLAPPFPPGVFDDVLSWGVIHHTPRPREAFKTLADRVAPGGRLGVYVYERHPVERYDNWGKMFVAMMRQGLLIRPLRFVCSRLPVPAVEVLSFLTFAWSSLIRFDVFGCADRRMREATWSRWRRVFVDRFHTRYASEHTVQELLSWFYEEGFDDAHVPYAGAVTASGRRGRLGATMSCRIDYNLYGYRTDLETPGGQPSEPAASGAAIDRP